MCKKNVKNTVILLLALLLCGSVSAKVNNYVGAYATAAEWTLLPSGSKYSGSLGFAGGIGGLYELQAGPTYSPSRFLLDVGVGAWGGMTSFMQGSDAIVERLNQHDLQNDLFDYVYEIHGRKDSYNNIAVQVPLMVGVQHNRFYMLVGAKLNASFWTKTKSTATLNTYGRYAEFGEMRNMPEYQFFENEKIKGGVKTSFNLDVDLSFEIGGRIGVVTDAVGFDVPQRKIEYRLAAFVDYGLFDLHNQGTKDALVTPSYYDINPSSKDYVYKGRSMVDNIVMNDIMSTSGFAKAVNNLTVGLKFTVLFQLQEEGKCVLCRDAYGSSVRRGRRGGVQYEE